MKNCPQCQKEVTNTKFCSRSCVAQYCNARRMPQPKKMVLCANCNIETTCPKFCSHSCCAKYHNKLRTKKPPVRRCKFCKKCNAELNDDNCTIQGTICFTCNPNIVDWSKITIKELKDRLFQQGSTLRFHARLRSHCRDNFKTYKCICTNCGYTKHTDICHIKAVSSFSDDTPISTVNDSSNLMELCKNCHWEFDNGLLSLP